jgi:hypothetical protein
MECDVRNCGTGGEGVLGRACAGANQFQPSLTKARNQNANMLSRSSSVKMRVKKKSRPSRIRPVWLREPSSFARSLLSCICTTFDPKF